MKEEIIENTAANTYLSFEMNNEIFAVNVSKVLNILEVINITKVPKSKKYMKGVLNLRGSVLPAVDLRIKFGLPEKENTKDTSIIVMNILKDEEEIMLGSIVDSVRAVLEIKESDIIPAPSTGTRYNSDMIIGLVEDGKKFIMLLDIDKVFASDEVVNVTNETISAEIEE